MAFNNLAGSSSGLGTSTSGPRHNGSSTNLSSLLVQANSLNQNMESDLPQIRFGIDEIERLSGGLGARSKRAKNAAEGQALLSNLGVNTSQLAHSISHFSGDQAGRPKRRRARPVKLDPSLEAGPSFAEGEGDVGAWARNWHEMIILSGIERQRERTVEAFEKQFQARLLSNWEQDKARILQDELGVTDDDIARLAGNASSSALGSSTLGKSSLGASTRKFPGAQSASTFTKETEVVMHTKMTKYGTVISDLNARRLRKEPFELCQALGANSRGDSKYPTLPTSYQLLAYIVNEPSLSDFPDAPPVQERQYAKAYLEEYQTRGHFLRNRLVAGGRRFLEKDFETHMDESISKSPKEAALGGIPGIENKVRAYVDTQYRDEAKKNLETVDGIHLWAQVYFLLRSGHPDAALQLLTDHQGGLRRDDLTLPGAFKSYLTSAERRVPKTQRDQLLNDFNGHVKTNPNVDPYKFALYKIIGRFELNRRTMKVAKTTEDWIWLNLTMVRESKEDASLDKFDLEDFGRQVLDYKSERFDSGGQKPLVWFNLLLFAGQFERALGYLYSKPQLRTDAVHFAVALQYYGLLRLSHPEDPTLVESADDTAQFNFARVIKTYISPIARMDPQSALQYAYLVAITSDAPRDVADAQKALCLELVRDVVLSSRAWGRLLGSVRTDGTKQPGLIERDLALLGVNAQEEYFKHIVLSAAEQSSLDSNLVDSIELYHLAGASDKVIETVNRALGSSLSLPNGAPAVHQSNGLGISGAFGGAGDLYSLAQRVHAVYERDFSTQNKVAKGSWETLGLLLKLKRALEQFANDRPDLALETFRSTGLLPLDYDASSLSRSSVAFKALLDNPAITSLDEIVITAMKCLYTVSQNLKNSPYGDQGRMAQLESLKSMARLVVQFASGLRLRLGADVYRQLSSMSAFF